MVLFLLGFSVILGVLAYRSYSNSEVHLHVAFQDLAAQGATLDTEECVLAVLHWHGNCEAMKSLCDHAIPMAMTHCLKRSESASLRAKERLDYCVAFRWPRSKAKWTYEKCKVIGVSKDDGSRRDQIKACGNAFSAIENFCRHNAEGVRL
jgi:hypothetical protein